MLFFNWSGGKDSALALYQLLQQQTAPSLLVSALSANRITMHGVQKPLVEAQAVAMGLPIRFIELPEGVDLTSYESTIRQHNRLLKQQGFTHAGFGDIFLEDLKAYREQLYAKEDIACTFPLWGSSTKELAENFIQSGFKAIVIAVNGNNLDPSFCGRLIDQDFLDALPADVDPGGENGEFHSFVFDGPLFARAVAFEVKEVVTKFYPAPVERDSFKEPVPQIPFHFLELAPTT